MRFIISCCHGAHGALQLCTPRVSLQPPITDPSRSTRTTDFRMDRVRFLPVFTFSHARTNHHPRLTSDGLTTSPNTSVSSHPPSNLSRYQPLPDSPHVLDHSPFPSRPPLSTHRLFPSASRIATRRIAPVPLHSGSTDSSSHHTLGTIHGDPRISAHRLASAAYSATRSRIFQAYFVHRFPRHVRFSGYLSAGPPSVCMSTEASRSRGITTGRCRHALRQLVPPPPLKLQVVPVSKGEETENNKKTTH